MRTNLVVAGVSSFVLATSSGSFSDLVLLISYFPFTLLLLMINQFYGKKTAAWGHTAEYVQQLQIKVENDNVVLLEEITTCDQFYKKVLSSKYSGFVRIDGPTKILFFISSVGFLYLFAKYKVSDEIFTRVHKFISTYVI